MYHFKKNPTKKEYIAQAKLSLDILFSNGKIGQPEYSEVVKTLKENIKRAEADTDGQ